MSAAAKEAGISKSLVSKWKKDKTKLPSPEVLDKLSVYFGIPISELLDEDHKTKKDPEELKLSEVDQELFEMLRQIPEDQKKLWLDMGRALADKQRKDL
jgi:transcriptional regulator with XRE-family HTH domain